MIGVRLRLPSGLRVTLSHRSVVLYRRDEVSGVLVRSVVVLELEGVAGSQAATVTSTGCHHITCFFFLHPKLGDRFALILGGVQAGIVEEFQALARGQIY